MDVYEYVFCLYLRDSSQSLSTEAKDLGSLASVVNFQWPGMFSIGDFCVRISHSSPAFQKPNNSEAVKRVIEELSTEGPKENLEVFTSFRTRRELYLTLLIRSTLI